MRYSGEGGPALASRQLGKIHTLACKAVGMSSLIARTRHRARQSRDGPLPALLLALTVLAGVVDAISILRLDRVFVANMTGNVIFIGFAVMGAKGFSVSASLVALGGFAAGATLTGWFRRAWTADRARLLRTSVAGKLALSLPAVVIVAVSGIPPGSVAAYAVTALLAASMGIQNATISRLAVPELIRTTVITTTLTGLFANLRSVGLHGPNTQRQLLSIGCLFAGAAIGAALVLFSGPLAALTLGAVLLAGVGAVAAAPAATKARWAPFPDGAA
jgi:uncharacterized membrane protein YoaK (UPF0700 family)